MLLLTETSKQVQFRSPNNREKEVNFCVFTASVTTDEVASVTTDEVASVSPKSISGERNTDPSGTLLSGTRTDSKSGPRNRE